MTPAEQAGKQFRDKHHLFRAKSRGGKRRKSNLLLIWRERHEAFHKLFGDTATIDDAINLLKRVKQAKLTQLLQEVEEEERSKRKRRKRKRN